MPEGVTGRFLGGEHDGNVVSTLLGRLRVPRLVEDEAVAKFLPPFGNSRMTFVVDEYRFDHYRVLNRLYGFWVPATAPLPDGRRGNLMEDAALLSLIDGEPSSNELIRLR